MPLFRIKLSQSLVQVGVSSRRVVMLCTLPIETLEHVVYYLESPQDLLHAALACKTLYKIIISTYRLHFTNISCNLGLDAPRDSLFWQALSTSRRFCSMVQQLEYCPSDYCEGNFFRINDNFLSEWAESLQVAHFPTHTTDFQCFSECLQNFRECRSVFVHGFNSEQNTNTIKELVACILANLSDNLDTLVLSFHFAGLTISLCVPRRDVLDPRYSFSRLTTFSIRCRFDHDLKDLLDSILDSLVYGCSTLVDFRFCLYIDIQDEFCYPSLIKDASWPSLKRFEFGGQSQLFTGSQKENCDICVSFMVRHAQLDRLRLKFVHNVVRTVFQLPLPYHALPRPWSLDFDFSLRHDVLPQVHHISNFQIYEPEAFRLARSLRSCTISITHQTRKGILQETIKAAPQLEHLCIHIDSCRTLICNISDCSKCIYDYGGSGCIAKLRNLKRFGLIIYSGTSRDYHAAEFLQRLAHSLPQLSHVYRIDRGEPLEYEVVKRAACADAHSFDFVPKLKRQLDPNLAWDFLLDEQLST